MCSDTVHKSEAKFDDCFWSYAAPGTHNMSVAPASIFPIAFQVLGSIAIVAAVALAVAGRERIRRFIVWWSERFSTSIVRLWLLFGLAFGAFLVYGVL